ncbi:phosphate acyltransferase PlsX [Salipiger sp. H15]|uniref:Phosphate acyltransferase n=1 Tax=Alloyangia sp. H15 TaxID=3029062 RepID=A0AAU8AFK4_9RHOB
MTSAMDNRQAHGPLVLSIDAMGGDRGPATIVAGLSAFARKHRDVRFVLHGPEAELRPLVDKHKGLSAQVEIRDASGVVSMEDKPSHVMRNGQDTSMWSTLDAVRNGEATVAVSCGNTGALMLLSMVRLRKLPGVNRPAIAVLWPSRNPQGYNVMLDVGADIRADADDLLKYAMMGASYARNGLSLTRPRVGLLNVGTEEHKGRAELKAANDLIAANAEAGGFDYVGFVEGGDIPGKRCDVIVTDGFTGNIALKTGEGTASLINSLLREAFTYSPLSRLAALLALSSLKRLQARVDPRRKNGGVFLGLNGTVVKSHGAADATGVAAAVELAYDLAQSGFGDRLAARVANAATTTPEADASATPAEDADTKKNGTGK